jgi:hypothetical protein
MYLAFAKVILFPVTTKKAKIFLVFLETTALLIWLDKKICVPLHHFLYQNNRT